MKQNVYFVSGIDTDAGKSYATGFLAREWNKNGHAPSPRNLSKQETLVIPEDIDLHRRIMGISFHQKKTKKD